MVLDPGVDPGVNPGVEGVIARTFSTDLHG